MRAIAFDHKYYLTKCFYHKDPFFLKYMLYLIRLDPSHHSAFCLIYALLLALSIGCWLSRLCSYGECMERSKAVTRQNDLVVGRTLKVAFDTAFRRGKMLISL